MAKIFTLLSLLCLIQFSANSALTLKSGATISEKKIFVRLYSENIEVLSKSENIKFSPAPFLHRNLSIKETKLSRKSYSFEQIKKIEKAEEPLFRTYILPVPEGKNPLEYCAHLSSHYPNLVEIAEPYYLPQITGSTPNDPDINKQNMLINIKALEAWQIFDGNSEIVIGISDIGINQDHSDLQANIAFNNDEIPDNGIDDDNNGYIDDYKGCNLAHLDDGAGWDNTYHSDSHGTEVAGIASATYSNNRGLAGIGAKTRFFPIKIAPQNEGQLSYSYESIRYAALAELDVLNCSWGSIKDYSPIDQSIIDFAVSKGVVIIASGGNNSQQGITDRHSSVCFPAGYDGVLGVGEVDNIDKVTGESLFGSQVRIVAPGKGNYTTTGSSYGTMGEGSSYSSPVVAGAAALALGKHPNLNPNQVIEFVRQCTDDVSSKNGAYANLLPGRVNLLKVVNTDPMSLAGIRFEDKEFYGKDGKLSLRTVLGETYSLKIKARNYLGGLKNVRFLLSQAYDPQNAIEVTKEEVLISEIQPTSYLGLNGFEIKIANESFSPVVMRIDVFADGDYHDFFKFDVVPTQNFITFQNGDLTLSFGDRGEFGYTGSQTQYGKGFLFKDTYNQLSIPGSGLIFTAGDSKAVTSFQGHFKTVEAWNSSNSSSLVSDEFASGNKVGIEIKQKVSFPSEVSNVARIDFTIYNKSGGNIANPSCGYYLDWDVNGDYDNNLARYFADAIPPELMGMPNYAVEMMKENSDGMPLVAAAAYSSVDGAVAQAAGTDVLPDNPSSAMIVELLNSGISKQVVGFNDRAMAIGMRFNKVLQANDSLQFVVLLAAADSETELANSLKSIALGLVSVAEETDNQFVVFPNPVAENLNLKLKQSFRGAAQIEIVSMLGDRIIQQDALLDGTNYTVDLSDLNLAPGIYIVKISHKGEVTLGKFCVVR